MKIAFRGNFGPSFSTESHVAASLESLDHTVLRIQESEIDWPTTVALSSKADMFLWTSTWGYAHQWPQNEAFEAICTLNTMLPTAAFHLDLFFGLERADQPANEPWFRLHHVFTADGGHDDDWMSLGINHHWSPPAVYHAEAIDGHPRPRYRSDIVFVGAHQHYGHPAHWPYRQDLLRRVKAWYPNRFALYPRPGSRAVRGHELNNLYASAKVVLGDSCLAGQIPRYWSDRTAETTGRGGFLVHPFVEGYPDLHPDVPLWTASDWDSLHALLDHYLIHDDERESLRIKASTHTRAHHTYRHRMAEVIAVTMGEKDEIEFGGKAEIAGAVDG